MFHIISCTLSVVPLLLSAVLLSANAQEMPTADDLDGIRRLYILEPEEFALTVTLMTQDALLLQRYGSRLSTEKAYLVADSIAWEVDGTPLIRESQLVVKLVDSLRTAFFHDPQATTTTRIDHWEHVSRLANRTPFVRGNAELRQMLEVESNRFFEHPDAFSQERLVELDRVSLEVRSVPFLRGSPALVARLKRARLEYANQKLSTEQLSRLDRVSNLVVGTPFRGAGGNPVIPIALIVVGGALVATYLYRIRFSDREPLVRQRSESDQFIQLARAYAILNVEPDCSDEDLREAFRRLQKQYHPDRVAHLGTEFVRIAEEKVREINSAYELVRRNLDS